ncbi:hypothetical protein FDZ73_10515 [bacterium]|nr:MAG: hypothetical protein FDZ73_10515 [bacterium]
MGHEKQILSFAESLPEKIANDVINVKAWIHADPLMAKAGKRIGGFIGHFFKLVTITLPGSDS